MGKPTQQEMESSSHMIGFFQPIEPIAALMLQFMREVFYSKTTLN